MERRPIPGVESLEDLARYLEAWEDGGYEQPLDLFLLPTFGGEKPRGMPPDPKAVFTEKSPNARRAPGEDWYPDDYFPHSWDAERVLSSTGGEDAGWTIRSRADFRAALLDCLTPDLVVEEARLRSRASDASRVLFEIERRRADLVRPFLVEAIDKAIASGATHPVFPGSAAATSPENARASLLARLADLPTRRNSWGTILAALDGCLSSRESLRVNGLAVLLDYLAREAAAEFERNPPI